MLLQCPRFGSFPPSLKTSLPQYVILRRASVAVITPPLIKTNGPSLGIAMLNGAISKAGHTCYSLDLNIHQSFPDYTPLHSDPCSKNPIRGDHDKDTSRWDVVSKEFQNAYSEAFANLPHIHGSREEAERHMWFDWLSLKEASQRLIKSQYGVKMGERLRDFIDNLSERPVFVGVSVMFSSQILVSMSISLLLRELLPEVPIVWGGPHISALRDEIFRDTAAYSHGFGIDLFVSGYAEKTFVTLTNWLAQSAHSFATLSTGSFGQAMSSRLGNHSIPFLIGCGDPFVRPIFPENLEPYCSKRARLTMPMQLRRGCAYGQCSFCTYPHVEGKPIGSAEQTSKILNQSGVIQLAQTLQGQGIETAISFKDALMPRGDLLAVSEHMSLQTVSVEWSACTKLSEGLEKMLKQLYAGGCRTLELGIETLDPVTASMINKPQSELALSKLLDSAAKEQLPLVLNYITGFPGEGPEAQQAFERLREEVLHKNVCMGLIAKIEHNTFQLERLSAMGRNPEKYGIFVPVDRAKIPAATVLPHCEVSESKYFSLSAAQSRCNV
jgi:hypothetical protein